MPAPQLIFSGVVKNGVVVPNDASRLPEGARVQIVLTPEVIPVDHKDEFDDWERVRHEAWRPMDEWEKEEPA